MKTEAKFYVYTYFDPCRNEVFYVGKGCNNREKDHLTRTDHHPLTYRLRQMRGAGIDPIITRLSEGLSADAAFSLEKSTIAEIGRKDQGKGPLLNLTDGGEGAIGAIRTNEHCAKISRSLSGKKKTQAHVDKINKNPEKIAKTAAKHRGMKRSETTRLRIKLKAQGRTAPNKNTKTYVTEDGQVVVSKIALPNSTLGDPRLKGKVGGAGKTWWFNPETLEQIMCVLGEQPAGWHRGKLRLRGIKRGN